MNKEFKKQFFQGYICQQSDPSGSFFQTWCKFLSYWPKLSDIKGSNIF